MFWIIILGDCSTLIHDQYPISPTIGDICSRVVVGVIPEGSRIGIVKDIMLRIESNVRND